MIKSVKGFNDILQVETATSRPTSEWRQLETILFGVFDRHGFEQVRLPIVEKTELFARSIGESTDIVEKEMFTFDTKSEQPTSITLRPEGTAGLVRAVIEHNLLRGDAPKLWYMGPMFRYERPQKGRYRQFYQLGGEVFGNALPDADAELIALTHMMWQELGIDHELTLQINTLGEPDERLQYRQALIDYLNDKQDLLDDDSKRRLTSNPLRILDSKIASTQSLLEQAPRLEEFLGEDSQAHFKQLQKYLTELGIAFEVNPLLVRGLDYYNKTVFEWVTDKLGSQATVCAGGRYDGLIGELKSVGNKADKVAKSEPAIGFAIGIERLLLLKNEIAPFESRSTSDIFVVAHPDVYHNGLSYAQSLRVARRDLNIKTASAASLKSQLKKADKSGAKLTVIIAHDEVANNQISIKTMATGEQITVDESWLHNAENFSI